MIAGLLPVDQRYLLNEFESGKILLTTLSDFDTAFSLGTSVRNPKIKHVEIHGGLRACCSCCSCYSYHYLLTTVLMLC